MFVGDENGREIEPTCRLGCRLRGTANIGRDLSDSVTTTRLTTYKLLEFGLHNLKKEMLS